MTRPTHFKQSLSTLILTACAIHSANAGMELSNELKNPQQNYNLMIGSMQYNFQAKTAFRYDTNYNRDSSGDESAAIIPGIGTQVYWPLTPNLTLSSGANISYMHYFESDADSGFEVNGGDGDTAANLDLDLMLDEDSMITVSNTASSTVDIIKVGDSTDRSQDNEAFRQVKLGTKVDYNQLLTPYSKITLGYGVDYNFSTDSKYDETDRVSHGPRLRAATEINSNTIAGLEGNAKFSNAIESEQNDSTRYRIVGDLEHTSDSGFISYIELGVDFISYDDDNSDTSDNDKDAPYVKGGVRFLTGEFFSHSAFVKYEVEHSNASVIQPTVNSTPNYGYNPVYSDTKVNYQEVFSIGYGVSYLITPELDLKFNYTFENVDQSEDGNNYNTHLASVGADYTLSEKATIAFAYTYEDQCDSDSDFSDTDYDRQIVQVSFKYDF